MFFEIVKWFGACKETICMDIRFHLPAGIFLIVFTSTSVLASGSVELDAIFQSRQLPPIAPEIYQKISREYEVLYSAGQQVTVNDEVEQRLRGLLIACRSTCNNRERAEIYLYLSMHLMASNKKFEALDYITRVIVQAPNITLSSEITVLRLAADLALGLRADIRADAIVNRMASLTPEVFEYPCYYVASILQKKQQYQESADQLDTCITQVDPTYSAGTAPAYAYRLKLTIMDILGETVEKETIESALAIALEQKNKYRPVFKLSAKYPEEALLNGVEGSCTVEYDILPSGRTHNMKIVNCTNPIFEENCIQAAKLFFYKPSYENGIAVRTSGVRNKFSFEMEKQEF